MDIKEYRQAILEAVLAAKDENGEPKIDELEAREMLAELEDEELLEGMEFNTPQDVADIILEEF
ncbi:hypothetical protein [Segatella albensis]|jgi:hypothetical protein|uniref:hypothetical protein n=1 Tax=Segatella albensis TaxID=77768 RepID=UPI0004281D7E|nr:hypothetical protein [Segatella albensis]